MALQSATVSKCSLTVLSTIVSRPSPNRLVLDAGSKTLSSDHARGPNAHRGFGAVLQTDSGKDINPNLVIERLSEEHAVVSVTGCEHSLTAGQRVRLIPNHACVVTHLAAYVHFVDEDSTSKNTFKKFKHFYSCLEIKLFGGLPRMALLPAIAKARA